MSNSITCDVILTYMSDMLFVMTVDADKEFRYAKMNPAAMRASGLNEYAYGATFQDVVVPSEASVLRDQYGKALQTRTPVSFILNHEGQIGESVLNPVIDGDGNVSHIIGSVRDITDRHLNEQRLKQQAYQDALTGLLNRHGLADGFERTIHQARRESTSYGVFVIDVDNLKTINDTYGHAMGDLYLQAIANRLRANLRSEDLIARLGGDEFLISLKVADAADTEVMAERIHEAFKTPLVHEDLNLDVSVSIGAATYPLDGVDIWDVVRAADNALYTAKDLGGKRYNIQS